MTTRRRMMNMRTGGLLDTEIKLFDENRGETALTAPTAGPGMEIQRSSGCVSYKHRRAGEPRQVLGCGFLIDNKT